MCKLSFFLYFCSYFEDSTLNIVNGIVKNFLFVWLFTNWILLFLKIYSFFLFTFIVIYLNLIFVLRGAQIRVYWSIDQSQLSKWWLYVAPSIPKNFSNFGFRWTVKNFHIWGSLEPHTWIRFPFPIPKLASILQIISRFFRLRNGFYIPDMVLSINYWRCSFPF